MNVLGNTTSLDGLLVTAAIVVLALSAAWLAVIWLAVLVEAASHGRRAPARFTGAPPALRRLLLPAACALLAILGVGGPATARPDVPATPVGATLDGLPMPVPPLGGVRDPGEPESTLTVAPGDSLWRIATRLRPGASAAETAALVHRLHRVNRAVIGADPDRLRPGQQLHLSASHRPDQPQESR